MPRFAWSVPRRSTRWPPSPPRQIHDLAGLASSLDARILAEAPRALAAGASGETAVLLRQAIAQLQFLHERPELAETRAATGVPGEVTLLGPALAAAPPRLRRAHRARAHG